MRDLLLNERAKRAAEFSPWRSERSEAEPWVQCKKETIARFSGHKTLRHGYVCRPLKRARCLLSVLHPGAALRLPWATFCRRLRRLVASVTTAFRPAKCSELKLR